MNCCGAIVGKKNATGSRSRGRRQRKVDTREVRQRFLIVCEGECTEPNYFKAFQTPGEVVITVIGVGESTLQLIEAATKKVKAREQGHYDQVWCVFDRDDCKPDVIHRAMKLAKEADYRVAFSNQAFELWYLLHFDYHHTAISRDTYCERLSQNLGYTYKKNSEDIYNALQDRQTEAIRNAQRLLDEYETWQQPAERDPSTTVHLLVEELNKHRRP